MTIDLDLFNPFPSFANQSLTTNESSNRTLQTILLNSADCVDAAIRRATPESTYSNLEKYNVQQSLM